MFNKVKNIINNKDLAYWTIIILNVILALEDFFVNKSYSGGGFFYNYGIIMDVG